MFVFVHAILNQARLRFFLNLISRMGAVVFVTFTLLAGRN